MRRPLTFSIFSCLCMCLFSEAFALQSTANMDPNRYMGVWFEVASVPSSSQKKCNKNSKAQYKIREDGKIEVRNTCIQKSGQKLVTEGLGEIIRSNENTVIKISYFPLLKQLGWFAGEFKILILDPNYQFAVVGDKNYEQGWILSRKPGLPLTTFVELETELRSVGYDSCRFVTSVQDRGFYTKKIPLCELVKNNPRTLENSNIM